MRVIYLDVLIIINIYVTYFLIAGTGTLMHIRISRTRMISASLFGGVTSLVILLPSMEAIFTVLIKLAAGALIVLIAIGFKSITDYLKSTLFFLLINFIYAGLTLALWLFCCPMGMQYNNGYAYFDISFLTILITTIIAYSLLRLFRYILDRRTLAGEKCSVTVLHRKKSVTFDALPDSGNLLTDFFTGLPVIIGKIDECAAVCPDNLLIAINQRSDMLTDLEGIRIIPCSTVCGSGIVYAFRPDSITITNSKTSKKITALLGFTASEKTKTAVFNPKIFL